MKNRSLNDLRQFLDKLLLQSPFQDHCPNGLQVEGKKEIRSIATAVSASLHTIEKTIEKGCDALIVHHGLFWYGDSYLIEGAKKRKIELLLKNDLSLLAYHLPLDANQEVGNNWRAARDMGWKEIEPFCEYKGQFIGVKGKFDPIPFETFQHSLEKYYGQKATFAKGGKEKIQSAALVSGGAFREVRQAAAAKVDAFVTGNFDEPAWHMAFEENIHFFALGHTATEKVGPKALADYINSEFGVPGCFIETDNPF